MTNYFSHDSNARNDERILRLRRALGARGYGIYFMLLERMREEADYTCAADYESLAFDIREKPQFIRAVVEDYGLFEFSSDGKRFFSKSFLARMREKDAISDKRRRAAGKRWEKANNQEDNETDNDANALQMQYKCNTNEGALHFPPCTPPESKENQREVNKININNNKTPSIPLEGGAEEGGAISSSSLVGMPTVARVAYIDEQLASVGIDDLDIDDYLRYSDLGTLCSSLPASKEELKEAVEDFKRRNSPQAPYSAIKAVRAVGLLVGNANDQEPIIDTFRTGTLANRKKNADIVLGIINTIERKRGSADEVRMPASFIKSCLNIR